jgi:hypothetical protein
MELKHLRYFVAVAEELNFSRAAGRVYLSQPALSQQIRKLEEELGITLFYRTRQRVELTEAGEVLLAGARQALVQVEMSVRAAREVGGAGDSRLKVGFPEYRTTRLWRTDSRLTVVATPTWNSKSTRCSRCSRRGSRSRSFAKVTSTSLFYWRRSTKTRAWSASTCCG